MVLNNRELSFVIDSYDRTRRQQDVILYERDIVQTPEADT